MADAFRHLIGRVERVAPNALEPVGDNRFRLGALAAAVFILLSSSGAAQPPRPGERTLHFTVFSAKPVAGLTYTPRPAAAPTPLVFYPTARSPRYEYRGAMPLRFTEAASGTVVVEAVVPAEMREALILFTAIESAQAHSPAGAGKSAAAGSLKYRVAVLDEDAAHHGAGQLEIINFSGLDLRGKINGQDVALTEGLNAPQAVGHTLAIALHTAVKGRTLQSYAENLTLKKNERALLILFPPYYKGSVEVQSRMLLDEPPPASKK